MDKEERTLRSRLPWLALVIIIPTTVYFISIGNPIYNLIVGILMSAMLWTAIRGLAWQKKHPNHGKRFFHFAVISFIALEDIKDC